MRTHHFWLGVLATALWFCPSPGRADLIPITGDAGLNGLGSFEGSLAYDHADAQHATLTVFLKNTSPAANGGYLTAFAFNNPGGHISGASLAGPANFSLLGGASFNNGVNGAPFGHFDLGASTGNSFEGGGKPSKGLGVGQSGTFVFTFTGDGLDLLNTGNFLSEKSVPPGAGEGLESFVARFRGFKNEGSDKVPSSVEQEPPVLPQEEPTPTTQQTPEPGALGLGGVALLGLLGWGWARRRPA